MKAPLPVTLITGYLGAGKTTLVNHLLADAHGRRLCVLVNDFGEIALDADLIVNQSGDTIALSNGCMCCTIGGDFFRAFDRILRLQPRPEHLVIETSGVADPFKIAQIAHAEPDLHLNGIVTVIDAVNFKAALADAFLGDTLRNQLAAAGLIVISKSDLVPSIEGLRRALADLAPAVPRLIADQGRVPSEMLLEPLAPASGALPDLHHHGAEYLSWVWTGAAPLDPVALEALLAAPIAGLYRLKGLVRLMDGTWAEVHRAGLHADRRPALPPRRDRRGRVVAVGLAGRFDPAELAAAWARALAGGTNP